MNKYGVSIWGTLRKTFNKICESKMLVIGVLLFLLSLLINVVSFICTSKAVVNDAVLISIIGVCTTAKVAKTITEIRGVKND